MSTHLLIDSEKHHHSSSLNTEIQVYASESVVSCLSRCIETVIVDDIQPIETCCHLIARRVIQIVAPLLATAAKLSFITISVDAAGSNAVLGGLLAYGNITAFSIIIGWCALNMIRDLIAPKHAEEMEIEKSKIPTWANIAIGVSSFVLGLFAQFSLAYLVYVYNNNNILMPIAVMVSDPWFPIYSTWCGLRGLAQQRTYSDLEKEILDVKQDHISGLRRGQEELSLISSTERKDFCERLGRVKSEADERIEKYTNTMLERKIEVIPRPSQVYQIAEKVIFAIGLVFLVSQYIVIGRTGFAGWQLVWDQKVFDGFMTAVVLVAYLYITGISIPNAATRLFGLVIGLVCCNYRPSLAQKSAPIMATLLTLVTLFTTGLSWGPNKQISEDYFNGWLQTFMLATAPASVVLLTTSIVLIVADIVLEHYVAWFKDDDARESMRLKWKYDDYIRIIDKCSVYEYAKFLKSTPLDCLDNISPKARGLVGRLDTYLAPQETSLLI
ncbi:hypothetical protein [Simkania negevensis]|uniref:Uncharacterized protein n=1 Tax=Simkania negevensis (strain ATCC VR-1471 / DSM 27360 / Z) TaxID=331113 RepID=F8L324_SIMNZ|nr:hypothetical protein [Simkania negevensis]CCB87870.1 unknown protein [Simkania negevensis Z]